MSQKALFLSSKKQGEWAVGEHTIPEPGPKDVLVKIEATALNPVDWKIRKFGYDFIPMVYPAVLGTDGAGVVEKVGAEVTSRKKGDKIVFQGWFSNTHATFQQYAIVPAEITAEIPENISFEQAASVPLAFATVTLALWNKHPDAPSARFPPPWEAGGLTLFTNKPAFIIGGASSVGQYAIQVAKLAGHSPIIATASPHNTNLLTSLGATHVIPRTLPPADTLAKLKEITGDAPISYVYDAISLAATQSLAYDALAPGGTLVLVLPDEIPAEAKAAGEEAAKKVFQVFGSVHPENARAAGIEIYKRLSGWLESGLIKPNKVEILPGGLAGIPEGLKRMEEDKVSGTKLIAQPQVVA